MQIQGTFDPKRFYETLARIISQKENVKITVTVHQESKEPEQEKATA